MDGLFVLVPSPPTPPTDPFPQMEKVKKKARRIGERDEDHHTFLSPVPLLLYLRGIREM